jgi:hypothetical protein
MLRIVYAQLQRYNDGVAQLLSTVSHNYVMLRIVDARLQRYITLYNDVKRNIYIAFVLRMHNGITVKMCVRAQPQHKMASRQMALQRTSTKTATATTTTKNTN